jgi:hypothetical protein
MPFTLDEGVVILTRTPAVLEALLSDLPETLLHSREGEGTFSPFDVLGHLIHGEKTDWIPRARIILEHGESKPFEPFDRRGHETHITSRPVTELLAEFAALRSANLATLRDLQLTPHQLDATGMHPDLGRVTLAQLLATWTTHDLGHLSQIVRVLARRNTSAVGPWRAYLSILGASAS